MNNNDISGVSKRLDLEQSGQSNSPEKQMNTNTLKEKDINNQIKKEAMN